MWIHDSNFHNARRLSTIAGFGIACAALLAGACGDDGTDRLSMCPDYRLESDRTGILRCAREADEPSSESGGAGKPAMPAAGENRDGATPAANSGSGGSVTSWYCQQVMNACSCVAGPVASDTCNTPRPTCCVDVKNPVASTKTCVCYPEGSAECTGAKMDSTQYAPVTSCPPK